MSGRAILLAFALAFPTVVTYAHFVALTPDAPAANPKLQTLYAAGKLTELALPLIYFFTTRRSDSSRDTGHGPRMSASRALGIGIGFGGATGGAILALYLAWLVDSPTFAGAAANVRAKVVEFGCDTPPRFLAFAAFLCLAHSLLEEYYWRWFAFGALRQTWPFWPAALLAGVAFMGHHVVVLSVYFPSAFCAAVAPLSLGVAVGGIAWSWLYERSGSLVGPWVSHVLIDAAIMAVGYRLLFGRP